MRARITAPLSISHEVGVFHDGPERRFGPDDLVKICQLKKAEGALSLRRTPPGVIAVSSYE